MIKAIIFDWSGVLSDDWEATFKAMNEVLEARSIPRISMKRFRELYELPWANFYKNLGVEIDMDEEYRLWHSFFPKYYHLLRPLPGAKKVLEWMKNRGVKVIILSSHQQQLVEDEIGKYGFRELIDAVDASRDDKRAKIKEFIEKHRIENEKTIYVGDMCHDIETARLAGVKSVAVLGGYDLREKLEREHPDYIIESVRELPALIEKMEAAENARIAANG